jgi:hypothetical protein
MKAEQPIRLAFTDLRYEMVDLWGDATDVEKKENKQCPNRLLFQPIHALHVRKKVSITSLTSSAFSIWTM